MGNYPLVCALIPLGFKMNSCCDYTFRAIFLRVVDYILDIGLQVTPKQFPFLRPPTQLVFH